MTTHLVELPGNYDRCPRCGEFVTELHQRFDHIDATRGDTVLEWVNRLDCPHCGVALLLVTELTHRLERSEETR